MKDKKIVSESKPTVEKQETKDAEYSVEILRDYYGNVDPFYLTKKDPNYAYRFLRDDHKNLSIKTSNLLLQKGGWQLCAKEHCLKLGIKEREISPDGWLRRGDTILAFMPKKLYEEKEKYKKEKAEAPLQSVKRRIEEGDSLIGKGIHETMRGIEPQKKLGM